MGDRARYNVSPPVILCFNFLLRIVYTENSYKFNAAPVSLLRKGSQRHLPDLIGCKMVLASRPAWTS